MKVYCKNCEYLSSISVDFICIAKENLREQSNWYGIEKISIFSPQDLNVKNHCDYYKEKKNAFELVEDE